MKKTLIPILSAGLMLAGCSAAYKTGQTPDDVYYSSSPKRTEVVAVKEPRQTQDDGYQSYFGNDDDNYLRMKVQNGGRWNTIDDYDYWYGYNSYNPYMRSFGFNNFNTWGVTIGGYNPYFGLGSYAYSNFYSPFSYGGGFFNPGYYYSPVYYPVIVNKRPTYFNNGYRPSLSSYQNGSYDRGGGNQRSSQPRAGNGQYRSIFNNGNNNSATYDRPARTFNNSSSNSSTYTPPSSGSSRTSSGGGSSSGSSSSGSSSSSSGRGGRGGN